MYGMYIRQSIILFVGLAVVAVSNGQNFCYTPSSFQGQCIPLDKCAGLSNFIDARHQTGLSWVERQFIIQSQCFSNISLDLHMCCNNDDPFLQTQAIAHKQYVAQKQPGSGEGNLLPDPSQNQCGRDTFTNRIYGGKDTELGEFPWMVLLEYQNLLGEREFACGGSLINSRYVLTAAHCLVGEVERAKGELINVRLGEHNLDTEQDCEVDKSKKICSDPVRDISIERKIPHPQYVPKDRNQYYDIGLVRLGQAMTFTEYIYPICLPSAHLRTETGHNLTVAGWGYISSGRTSPIKQQLSIPVNDQQECRNKFSSFTNTPVQIDDIQLCAGGEFNRDSCSGDSGGPLMSLIGSLWYVEGLVSFGSAQCGLRGLPGVYTRVPRYLDWIRSNLEP